MEGRLLRAGGLSKTLDVLKLVINQKVVARFSATYHTEIIMLNVLLLSTEKVQFINCKL